MVTKLTRKHFKVIAEVIKEASVSDQQRKDLAYAMASELRQFNDHFDYNRFIEACGVAK